MYNQNTQQPPYGYPPAYQNDPYAQPQTGYAPYPSGQPGSVPYPSGQPAYPPYPPASPNIYPGHPQHGSPEPIVSDMDPKDGGFAATGFNNKIIRHAFIKKVYLILTTQLLVTGAFIAMFLFLEPVSKWVARNSWFYYLSYGVFLCTYIALVCCPNVRRRFPGNFIALGIFTLAFSYMTATATSFYKVESVLIAVAITGGLCIAISLFAMQTRFDFTKCTALIFVLSVVVMLTGLVCMIMYMMGKDSRILQAVYGGLAALLFGLYLAYDTQSIMGGRQYELSPEEYIFGALQLYLDVVNLFLIMLSLFGSRND